MRRNIVLIIVVILVVSAIGFTFHESHKSQIVRNKTEEMRQKYDFWFGEFQKDFANFNRELNRASNSIRASAGDSTDIKSIITHIVKADSLNNKYGEDLDSMDYWFKELEKMYGFDKKKGEN